MNKKPSIEDLYVIIEIQQKQISELRDKVSCLEDELRSYKTKKNSNNSSIPPSQDEFGPTKNQSLRKKSNKKVGGQRGHKGQTLEMTSTPDKVIKHIPGYCEKCGNDIQEIEMKFIGRRQIIDIPPVRPIISEHRIYKRKCSCGHETCSDYPENITAPVSYGQGVESLIGYLHSRHYIPFIRMQEVLSDVFNLNISEGGIHYLLNKLIKKAIPVYNKIQEAVFNSDVIGSDETGAKINGQKNWFWTWQSKKATFINISPNRGIDTITENCDNHAQGSILVHDCYSAHFHTLTAGHQICTAHLLRDLNYLEEKDGIKWPTKFKEMLMDALALKRRLSPPSYLSPVKERDKLEEHLSRLLKVKIAPGYKETVTFQKRMVKYKEYLFTFLYHPEVPPDNNASERAIRNVKVKQKVSGQFKSINGAKAFAVLRSITDTAIKNGQNVLNALKVIANLDLQTD